MLGFHVFVCAACLSIASLLPATVAAHHGTVHAASHSYYSRSHSLGESYHFDERDGWEAVNVTNMQHARPRELMPPSSDAHKRAHHSRVPKSKGKGVGSDIEHVVNNVWEGLKAIGSAEPVEITWYTGQDLLNPSCWSNSGWHPSDASFAAAVTLSGWTNKPKCFKFLELCNSPKKCVFVRVVDTCAGCASGSKHCDLTRAAFGELADFAEGALTVQLRAATDPSQWHDDLWGPKA